MLSYVGIVNKENDLAGKWRVNVNLTDITVMLKFQSNPSDNQVETEANLYIAKVNLQEEFKQVMNLSGDEEKAIEYLRNVKRDLITRIREFPSATLTQAQTYIAGRYPNSIINFDNLYAYYQQLLGGVTWAQFKTWVINHKFSGID